MEQIQQHIAKLREALEKATPDWHYNGNEIVSIQNVRCGIGGFLKEEDNYLASNSPTWHQQSIELLEQQQREIDKQNALIKVLQQDNNLMESVVSDKDGEIERLREALVYTQIGLGNAYEYGYLKETGEGDVQMMIDRINAALSPKEEQTDAKNG